MKLYAGYLIRSVCGVACLIALNGCESGGDSHDFGTNNPDVIVAMGDSITALEGGNTTTYPALLAAKTGKTVINQGSGGATSGDGAGRIGGVLSGYKPGYVLILYGANDVIIAESLEGTIANLRHIITSAQANKTVPIIATITPMYYEHAFFLGATKGLNVRIRQLASETGCAMVDLESAFGGNTSYFNDDGLHPNDSGLAVIANSFAGAL